MAGPSLLRLALSILSAGLLLLSFPHRLSFHGFWPLAWVFAVPLFFALRGANTPTRLLLGGVFAFFFYGPLVDWFLPYSRAGYVLFVVALSVAPVLFCVLYTDGKGQRPPPWPAVPALWVASETIRSQLMQGFSWDLGHSQAFQPVILQTAALAGSAGLSFCLIMANVLVFRILTQKNKLNAVAALVTLGILIFGYGHAVLRVAGPWTPQPDGWQILSVQPNIDYRQKSEPSQVPEMVTQLVRLTRQGLQNGVDLIVWPETAVPTDIIVPGRVKNALASQVQSWGVPLLTGAALFQGDKNLNSAVLISNDGKTTAVYHKRGLIPFSEWTPPGPWGPRIASWLRIREYGFLPGERPGILMLTKPGPVPSRLTTGVLICSEDTLGGLFSEYARQGVDLVLVLLNDGWFREQRALALHAQNAIIHAVETRVPVLRVANTGWSCLIDGYGRLIGPGERTLGREEFFLNFISAQRGRTLYNLTGDLVPALCLAGSAIFLARRRFLREK